MKLKILPLGQRDSQWSTIPLGYNKASDKDTSNNPFSIGYYGCLITCWAMYLSAIGKIETPETLNQKLKDIKGYAPNSGNLIWNVLLGLYGLKEFYRSPYYSGPVSPQGLVKIRELLDASKPLITHVDFDPRDPDDDQHWILVHGYEGDTFFALDPWSGREITLDVYGGAKRAVLEYRGYNIGVPSSQVLDYEKLYNEAKSENESLWNYILSLADKLRVPHDKEAIIKEIEKFLDYERIINDKNKELEEKTKKILELEEKLSTIEVEHQKLKDQFLEIQKSMYSIGNKVSETKTEVAEVKRDVVPQKGIAKIIQGILDILLRR